MKRFLKWTSRALVSVLTITQIVMMVWLYDTMNKVEFMEAEYHLIDAVYDITPATTLDEPEMDIDYSIIYIESDYYGDEIKVGYNLIINGDTLYDSRYEVTIEATDEFKEQQEYVNEIIKLLYNN